MEIRSFVSGFTKGFKEFGENITNAINFILLFLVYFIGVGPTSIVSKLAGKHFLELRAEKRKKTYWKELGLKKEDTDSYYRQF